VYNNYRSSVNRGKSGFGFFLNVACNLYCCFLYILAKKKLIIFCSIESHNSALAFLILSVLSFSFIKIGRRIQ
jgi:hypothetical protein